jgi:hypothetical protein
MPVVFGNVVNVAGIPLEGTLWVSSPDWRPGGTAVVSMNRKTYLVEAGHFRTDDLVPGKVLFEFRGDGDGQVRRKSYEFVVPDQDDELDFLDLLDTSYEYPPEVVGQAQQAAREARESANDAAASAAIVGSAEAVLAAEAASEASRVAAESARDAAASSAAASASSASDSAAARDAAVVAQGGAESARAGAESAQDGAVVAQGKAELAEDGAVAAKSGAEDARDAAVESASDASSSATAADGSAAAAALSASAAAGSAAEAESSASAADTSAGLAANAADSAATAVTDQLSGFADAASGSASAAADSAAAAAQSAQDAASVVSDGVADASATVKGKVRLAGDLGGTADAPTVPALEDKSDVGHGHTQGEIEGLTSALDQKVTATSSSYYVYATGGLGVAVLLPYSSSYTPASLALRTSGGNVQTQTPTANWHATPKNYVDARPALFSGEGDPPSTIAGAVVGDWWLNTATMELSKITGV